MDIVFILASIINPNSIKRINEFAEKGYNIKVYGFDRCLNIPNKLDCGDIITIGEVSNSSNYLSRVAIYINGIKKVLQDTDRKKSLYYLIGFDVMLYFKLLSCRRYIYEEPDLVYANKLGLKTKIFAIIDRYFIRHSLLTVFRSDGFAKFHFNGACPNNIMVIPNKLNKNILSIRKRKKIQLNSRCLKIGFVGLIRYDSIYNFADVFCRNYPQSIFYFYGTFGSDVIKKRFEQLKKYSNCIFHGAFRSPDDLPQIYSQLDLVLSTYDISNVNVRYAEPNKIYEAIYFETPIIVSSDTFLANKVSDLGIGYDVNAKDENSIIDLIEHITIESIDEKRLCMSKISLDDIINSNVNLFEYLYKNGVYPT